MRLNNGTSTAVLDWGPGGDTRRPQMNRYMKLTNSTGKDMFLPENSAAEKLAVYNSLSVSGVTKLKGQYYVGSTLYNNTAAIGTGPCWFGNSNSAAYVDPPACPSGFTTGTTADANNVNANDYIGNTSILHGNVSWMSFQYLNYGCSSGVYAKFRVRYCTF